MLMADAFAITLTIIGFLLAYPALWLVCRGFWPEQVARAETRAATQPFRSFFCGALIWALGIGWAALIGSAGGLGAFISVASICVLICWAHLGVAGLVTHLGKRLPSPVDADRPWRATLRGGVALELTWLFPLMGWFGLLPISWIIGTGAATLAWKDGRRERKAARSLITAIDVPVLAAQAAMTTPTMPLDLGPTNRIAEPVAVSDNGAVPQETPVG
jgi:hypothetical protein